MKISRLCAGLLLCPVIIFCSACTSLHPGGTAPDKVELLRIPGEEICQETRTGRMWLVGRGGEFASLAEAREYVANLRVGGYKNWRLPTRQESLALMKIFYWKKNGDCDLESRGDYWTVSEDGKASIGHWEDYLLCSPEFKYVSSLNAKGYVRAVRP